MGQDKSEKKSVLVVMDVGDQLKDWPGFYPCPLAADDRMDGLGAALGKGA